MSNLIDAKPRVKTITLNDGVEREIRFTLNALAELEDKFGSVDAAFAELDKGSVKAVRFVLWAGLSDTDEGLTEQQVGRLIDLGLINDIMEQLGNALHEDLPAPSEDGNAGQVPNV